MLVFLFTINSKFGIIIEILCGGITMMKPLVTLIIPVYNLQEYVLPCLQSINNQTYDNLEVLLINDGSTDNSQTIIEDYIFKYNLNWLLLNKDNGGQSSSRNLGLDRTSGEYVLFIDGDDFIELDMVQKMVEKAMSSKADIVVCDFIRNFENNSSLNFIESGGSFSEVSHLDVASLFYYPHAVWNKLFKSDVIKDLRFVDGLRYEDLPFTIFALINTKKIVKLDLPLYHYMIRDSDNISTMQTVDDKIFDIYSVLEIVYNEYGSTYSREICNIMIRQLFLYLLQLQMKHSDGIKNIILARQYITDRYPKWYKFFDKNSLTYGDRVIVQLIRFKLFRVLEFLYHKRVK